VIAGIPFWSPCFFLIYFIQLKEKESRLELFAVKRVTKSHKPACCPSQKRYLIVSSAEASLAKIRKKITRVGTHN